MKRPLHRRAVIALLVLALLGGYWLLPISGRVLILTDPAQQPLEVWPQIWTEPAATRPGDPVTVYVRDTAPWAYVKLTVDGADVPRDESYPTGANPWTWRWRFPAPDKPGYAASFYHDCQTGCVERGRIAIGQPVPQTRSARTPTKLGVVFADPQRDWHGRAGWTVLLTYMQRQDNQDFSIDGLARQIAQARAQGLRPLVRIAYDYQQALPPAGDEVALRGYLDYCARLASDDRLGGVYAYIIGAGFNGREENAQASDHPTTPEWYARVFNGYGLAPERADNVAQTMRARAPGVRLLVGAVTPWNTSQNGALADPLNLPWLNYMNTLVSLLDTAAQSRANAGRPGAVPDGFALNAPGRPGAPEVAGEPAREPATDLRQAGWGNAQAGFRVYRDWLAIINRYPTTRGLPAYITSTNTWTGGDATLPAQNYPAGWLTNALREIAAEPQIQALCWFVDAPLGGQWEAYSLEARIGRMNDAATEFDSLLRQ